MKTGDYRTAFSEINVTPFVDVMLVLLIIFMVTAPLLEQGFNVSLPKAATSKQLPRNGSGLVITLTKDQLMYLGEELVTLKELRHQLKTIGGNRPVLIRSDRYAYVDKLIELWDLCRDTGFREVHIATLPE